MAETAARAAEEQAAGKEKPLCQRHVNAEQGNACQQQAAADQQPVGDHCGGMTGDLPALPQPPAQTEFAGKAHAAMMTDDGRAKQRFCGVC
uniref:hypothetical protein n=1 Tax=Candidatus Electronema sp. TaxID=2698783 RepID=UPI004055C9E7